MVDTILQFLTWAIPSGGIGAAIAWIANRKVKSAESAKKIHDTYKEMYDDISRELLTTQKKVDDTTKATEQLRDENARTRRALNRLSKAIEAIQVCPHRSTCPVSSELRLDEDDAEGADTADGGGKRKPRQQRKPKPDGGEPTGGDGNQRPLDAASLDHHAPARRERGAEGTDARAAQGRQHRAG